MSTGVIIASHHFNSISRSQGLNCCLRYKELEDALSVAEQHLGDGEQQQAMQQIQDQIDQLQQQLHAGSSVTQELQQQHEAVRAAQQMATEELIAATQQFQSIQVTTALVLCM